MYSEMNAIQSFCMRLQLHIKPLVYAASKGRENWGGYSIPKYTALQK